MKGNLNVIDLVQKLTLQQTEKLLNSFIYFIESR